MDNLFNAYDMVNDSGKVLLQNFDSCPRGRRAYGGNAGRKVSIVWRDAHWMVKFPESTAGMKGDILSYTTSPIAEWAGSHIYASLGIPVHDTVLGTMQGKVVVACRDFTSPKYEFYDLHDIKNMVVAENPILPDGRESTGASAYLSDIVASIHTNPLLLEAAGTEERFWDMFCVDAFIGNADRDNTNWGFFVYPDRTELAPVFDNGNCMFNKRKPSKDEQGLSSSERLVASAITNPTCAYTFDDGTRIHPFMYLRSTSDPDCVAAATRFCRALSLENVNAIVDAIPKHALGTDLMTEVVSDFHKEIFRVRYEKGFVPALDSSIDAAKTCRQESSQNDFSLLNIKPS